MIQHLQVISVNRINVRQKSKCDIDIIDMSFLSDTITYSYRHCQKCLIRLLMNLYTHFHCEINRAYETGKKNIILWHVIILRWHSWVTDWHAFSDTGKELYFCYQRYHVLICNSLLSIAHDLWQNQYKTDEWHCWHSQFQWPGAKGKWSLQETFS